MVHCERKKRKELIGKWMVSAVLACIGGSLGTSRHLTSGLLFWFPDGHSASIHSSFLVTPLFLPFLDQPPGYKTSICDILALGRKALRCGVCALTRTMAEELCGKGEARRIYR